jgi:methyltransferase (TIGR00027 family)
MQKSRPSRTALRVALRRAAHQVHDAAPRVLDDPFAVPILGPHAADLARTPDPAPGNRLRPFSAGLRAFLVARSRYAEDLLAEAVATRGVPQYVLLGAGLDTFAHRNPHPGLRVFEVDHPATQQWKRELIAGARLAEPAGLIYVPVDFERQSLAAQLLSTGHSPSQPTFFAWLGVVPYLTLPAFRATVAFIAAQPPGSGVVFDYGQPREVLPFFEQLAHDSLAARVKQAGEPFQSFFTPREVAAELAAFYDLEDLGAPELNARYFDARGDSLRMIGTAGRMVSAWL